MKSSVRVPRWFYWNSAHLLSTLSEAALALEEQSGTAATGTVGGSQAQGSNYPALSQESLDSPGWQTEMISKVQILMELSSIEN